VNLVEGTSQSKVNSPPAPSIGTVPPSPSSKDAFFGGAPLPANVVGSAQAQAVKVPANDQGGSRKTPRIAYGRITETSSPAFRRPRLKSIDDKLFEVLSTYESLSREKTHRGAK
jgi:hypothetical protein